MQYDNEQILICEYSQQKKKKKKTTNKMAFLAREFMEISLHGHLKKKLHLHCIWHITINAVNRNEEEKHLQQQQNIRHLEINRTKRKHTQLWELITYISATIGLNEEKKTANILFLLTILK